MSEEFVKKNNNYQGTRLYDFLYLLSKYDWTNDEDIMLDCYIDDSNDEIKLSVEQLKEKYGDYQLLDYDLWHEVIDDSSYSLQRMIQIYKVSTPPTANEIVKEFKNLKGYENKRVEYLNGNFVYYPMDSGIMKNNFITIAGNDRNGYRIQGPITKEFMHKITTFFMNRSDE